MGRSKEIGECINKNSASKQSKCKAKLKRTRASLKLGEAKFGISSHHSFHIWDSSRATIEYSVIAFGCIHSMKNNNNNNMSTSVHRFQTRSYF